MKRNLQYWTLPDAHVLMPEVLTLSVFFGFDEHLEQRDIKH